MKPTDIKPGAAAKDELLDAYRAAAKEDGFAPAPRVRGAVLMYARTLADHRNAFPGSVAHRNEDEEMELSSVPVVASALDPRPLPVKPLDDETPSWPRELPPAPAPSVWVSLGKWVGVAAVGGLALGASFSWFNANLYKPAAPEPVLVAQAPAPVAIPIPPAVSSELPIINKPNVADTAPVSKTSQAEQASLAERKAQASPKPVATAPAQAKARTEPAVKELPAGATNNPSVMVAQGRAIAQPQIAARSLSDTKAAEPKATDASAASKAPVTTAAATAPSVTPPAAVAVAAAPATTAASTQSIQSTNAAAQGGAPAVNKVAARPEHEADPQAWMSYILDLRSRGRSREASIELVRLRERYPKFNAGTPAGGSPPNGAANSPSMPASSPQ